MRVDSHHHLWKYDPDQYPWIDDAKARLKQDFGISELRELARENEIDTFITVQARQNLAETRDLLALASESAQGGDSGSVRSASGHSLIGGVIGWVPLADPDVGERIEAFADNRLFKGVRHVVQDEPDDRFLDGNAFNAGVSQLADQDLIYELLIFPKQLPAAIDFADRHPNIRVVLDHIAKPRIEAGKIDEPWRRSFCELARRDHVSCKFSGVVTEVLDDDWSIETIRPYFDLALEAFGIDRLMYGSDWPVCLLATDYSRWLATATELTKTLSKIEQEAFLGNNAMRIYGIGSH